MKVNQGCSSHIGRRKDQQDAYGFSDFEDRLFIAHGGVLAVVCDGMGGLEKGDEASRLAVKTLLESYMAKTTEESVTEALDKAIAQANRAVIQLGIQTGHRGNVGSTLVAAVVYEDELFWRSAGDSRIYWSRNQQLTQLSTDHNYAQELMRDPKHNQLSPEDIANHPQGNALVSYLGVGEDMAFEQNERPVKLHPGDTVFICSDGIYNTLDEAEIAGALQLAEAMKSAQELQHRALDKQLF
ncbi:MAG: protein phosphatase 2C domain-containing protein, partial [Methylococcaceae bacterium]